MKSAVKHGNCNSMHSSADGQFWTGSNAGLFRWTGDAFAAVAGFEDVELMSGQAIASDATNLYVAAPSGLRSMPLQGRGQTRLVSPKGSFSAFVASDQTVWFSCGLVLCSLKDGHEEEWGGEPWRDRRALEKYRRGSCRAPMGSFPRESAGTRFGWVAVS